MQMNRAVQRLGDRVAKILTEHYTSETETDFSIDVSRTKPNVIEEFVTLSFGNFWDPPTHTNGYQFDYDVTARRIWVRYDKQLVTNDMKNLS